MSGFLVCGTFKRRLKCFFEGEYRILSPTPLWLEHTGIATRAKLQPSHSLIYQNFKIETKDNVTVSQFKLTTAVWYLQNIKTQYQSAPQMLRCKCISCLFYFIFSSSPLKYSAHILSIIVHNSFLHKYAENDNIRQIPGSTVWNKTVWIELLHSSRLFCIF